MATPSLEDGTDQVRSNVKDAAIAGGSIAAGNVILGQELGPAAGGVLAGTVIGGSRGDTVTVTGAMIAGNNVTTPGGELL